MSLLEQMQSEVEQALRRTVANGDYQRYQGENCSLLCMQLGQLFDGAAILPASSGTAALEIALRAAGIADGDHVMMSAYDYPGNFWAIERVGARPMLLDCQKDDWRIDLNSLEQAREILGSGSAKALIVSHLHARLQPMDAIRSWCDEHEVCLIEDCCQSIDAVENGNRVGSQSDMTVVSFGGGKILSAGRGGALITKNPSLMQRARLAAGAGSGPYGLSELQAAVVVAKLKYLVDITVQCREYFTEFGLALQENFNSQDIPEQDMPEQGLSPLVLPGLDDWPRSSFYQAGLLVPMNTSRELIASKILEHSTVASIGNGFPGLHRRSEKRCSQAAIVNATKVSARTMVVHHMAALLPNRLPPTQLAEILSSAILSSAIGSAGSSTIDDSTAGEGR